MNRYRVRARFACKGFSAVACHYFNAEDAAAAIRKGLGFFAKSEDLPGGYLVYVSAFYVGTAE